MKSIWMIALTLCSSLVWADAALDSPSLDYALNPTSKLPKEASISNVRRTALINAAQTVGLRAGQYDEGKRIIARLEKRAAALDRMYNFNLLLIDNNTLPPVIVESNNNIAQDSPALLRVIGKIYRIEEKERLVSVAPTFRDYLLPGLVVRGEDMKPEDALLPRDDAERALWQTTVRAAYEEGKKVATETYTINFNRMERKFYGMALYKSVVKDGLLTPTVSAVTSRVVSGGGDQMYLDDSLRQITRNASFNPNSQQWKPEVTGKPHRKMNDDDAQNEIDKVQSAILRGGQRL
jgi:defect-in-organelle-trafficking protein DotC